MRSLPTTVRSIFSSARRFTHHSRRVDTPRCPAMPSPRSGQLPAAASRVSRGCSVTIVSTVSPAPMRSRMLSTVMRVPAITGFSIIMSALDLRLAGPRCPRLENIAGAAFPRVPGRVGATMDAGPVSRKACIAEHSRGGATRSSRKASGSWSGSGCFSGSGHLMHWNEVRAGRGTPQGMPMMAMPQVCGAPPRLWLSARVGFFTWRLSALPWSCL